MAVCPPVPQHSQLYGPHRNIGAKKLQRVLCKTYIFQDGEYNYTSKRLSKDVWQTSSARDFSFGNIEGLKTLPTEENQLESHFEIHQTDPDFPITTMQAQTTNGDYDKKISVRPYVFTEDKTVNWTDMSPRYTSRRHLGSTEYDFTYIMSHDHNPRRPRFPKINTCRMKLPPDASRFWVQRGTNFNLGSDKICSKSEQHSSFSEAHKHRSDWLHHNDEDHLLNVSMRDQERSSYVLRDGDYNSILGDFDKTSYNEYGPRTLPHWILPRVPTFNAESKRIKRRYRGRWKDVHVSEDDSEEDCEHEDRNEDLSSRDKTNELTKYARECTCPDIMSAGKNVEHDQKETHFQFGTDCNRPESMYDKDYIMAMHRTPRFYVTPSAGNLLQFDEDYSKLAVTSHCSDFSNIVASSVPDKESAQKTMNQQFKDNVRSSCNQSNSSTVDYQLSLSHEDYIPLRRPRTTNFKLHHNSTPASFLDTDGVLPHPVTKVNISEAANNFSGAFNDENLNTDGLRARKCQCRSRVNENDMAHFVMGSVPELTQSETITRFDGKPCEENETLAAGKTEFIPPFTFTHLNVSENTEDLERKGKKFPNTIMKCDYVPLEERGFTDSQEVINAKFDVLMLQSIARSHLFHHDINNEKHLISTTMNDFTEPASMTGKKVTFNFPISDVRPITPRNNSRHVGRSRSPSPIKEEKEKNLLKDKKYSLPLLNLSKKEVIKEKGKSAFSNAAVKLVTPKIPAKDGKRHLNMELLTDFNTIASRILNNIEDGKKERLRSDLTANVDAIQERIKKVLDNSQLDVSEDDEVPGQPGRSHFCPPVFDSKEKRERMDHQKSLMHRLADYIESCHERMSLITDLSEWIQSREGKAPVENFAALDAEMLEFDNAQESIVQSLGTLEKIIRAVCRLGFKVLKESGFASTVAEEKAAGLNLRREKPPVFDDRSLMGDSNKWDLAIKNIGNSFEDCIRWTKNTVYKTHIRAGQRQFKFFQVVVDKKLADLAEKKSQVEDLKTKVTTGQSHIEKNNIEISALKKANRNLKREVDDANNKLMKMEDIRKSQEEIILDLKKQIEELKEEIANIPVLPPPAEAPPTPEPVAPPPTPSPPRPKSVKFVDPESTDLVKSLRFEIQESKSRVNIYGEQIRELERLLKIERDRVKALKAESYAMPEIKEPIIEIPADSPLSMATDASSGYYKTLLTGVKRDFAGELDKIKEHVMRERQRADALIRRAEVGHKEQLQSIHKDCVRIFRGIVHFKGQLAKLFEKESLDATAHDLINLPPLVPDVPTSDPKHLLSFMTGNVVEYLHNMELIIANGLLMSRLEMKTEQSTMQQETIRQMRSHKDTVQNAKHQTVALAVKLQKTKEQFKKMDIDSLQQKDEKYMSLMERYHLVWKMYNNMQKDMNILQNDLETTIEKKVTEREEMVVKQIQMELKEKRAIQEHNLQMTLADQKRNMKILDNAFADNRITKELYTMATDLMRKSMEMTNKRFRYLLEKYIAFKAVQDGRRKLQQVLDEEDLAAYTRNEITTYLGMMDQRLTVTMNTWNKRMSDLEQEKRDVFRQIWTIFNEVLVTTGLNLIQPVLKDMQEELPPIHPLVSNALQIKGAVKRRCAIIGALNRLPLLSEPPQVIMGNSIPIACRVESKLWTIQPDPAKLRPLPQVDTPHLMDIDINYSRLKAKRALKKSEPTTYPLSTSRSYDASGDQLKHLCSIFSC